MKKRKAIHHYAEEFNTSSANIIVPFLINMFHPKSVIDVGCGIGTWLKVFNENGINNILGVDGPHVLDTSQLLISAESFIAKDLRHLKHTDFKKTFDLAVCLEVAEHLNEDYADSLVSTLCSLSQIIIFFGGYARANRRKPF